MRDFIGELKALCAGLDHAESKPAKLQEKLFDIRKRSLPVGIDKPVVLGVTKADAKRLIFGSLKPKVLASEDGESKQVIYYDVVPAGSHQAVYFNHVKLLKEGI